MLLSVLETYLADDRFVLPNNAHIYCFSLPYNSFVFSLTVDLIYLVILVLVIVPNIISSRFFLSYKSYVFPKNKSSMCYLFLPYNTFFGDRNKYSAR